MNREPVRRECLKAQNIKTNIESTNHMINTLKQSTGLARLTKTRFLSIAAVTALVLTATFLRADSGRNEPEANRLAGTWVGNAGSTLAPALASFMADGRVLLSRPVAVPTGPGIFELATTGHGEWKRISNDEFVSTVVVLRSGQSMEFTGLVKLILTIKLDRATDQLAVTGTVYIYDAAGNLLGALPQPGVGTFKRIVAGE
jgi:hypothetical protein